MEVMITVVIVGILFAVALPAYQDYVKRGHRSAAQGEMLDIANRQQQNLLASRSYAATLAALPYTVPPEVAARYTCSMSTVDNAATPPVFTVSCVPTAAQASSKFGTLTLTNTGVKSPAGEW